MKLENITYKSRNLNLLEPNGFRSKTIEKDENSYKVVLISPQIIGAKHQVRKATPPLGQAYLAGVLEAKGHEVMLIDAAVEGYSSVMPLGDYIESDHTGSFIKSSHDDDFIIYGLSNNVIVDKVRAFSPDIVGVSSLFSSQTECAYSIIRSLKKTLPRLTIVMGGNHTSQHRLEIMKSVREVDFIVAGEADFTFSEFVVKFLEKKDYKGVPGLVWREGNEIHENAMAPFVRDMDAIPFPALHLYDMESYFDIGMPHNPFIKSNRFAGIMTSRGCPEFCYFCTTPDYLGGKFRAMSVDRTIELVRYSVDKWDIKELQILDDTFTSNYKRTIQIMDGIKHLNLRISLPNAIRADRPLDEKKRLDMFKSMAGAGVEQVGISIEHGDEYFLNNIIQKGLSLDQAVRSIDLCHQAGILVHTNFMMGFPFEKKEHRSKTIDFAKSIDSDSYSVSLVAPLPGTPIWEICKKNNLFMPEFNVNRVVFSNVNIIPDDILPEDLSILVDTLNRELNEKAQNTEVDWRRKKIAEKYALFDKFNKTAEGDRKYHFSKK